MHGWLFLRGGLSSSSIIKSMAGLQYYFFPTDFFYPRTQAPTINDNGGAGWSNDVVGSKSIGVHPIEAPRVADEDDLAKEGPPKSKGSSLGRKPLALPPPSKIEGEKRRAEPVVAMVKPRKIAVDDPS